MTRFELFCMIFYVIDFSWSSSHDEALLNFLSDANPFLFADTGSAVPEVFTKFCESVPEKISVKQSLKIAEQYITSLNSKAVSNAFRTIDKNKWFTGLKKYLSQPHKK